jgi:N-acetyl-anhydromuramyl-L-alanine amidase AmpD
MSITIFDGELTIVDWRNRTDRCVFFGDRNGSISVIDVHHTVTPTAIQTLHVMNRRSVSAHYIVDRDGTIYYTVSTQR